MLKTILLLLLAAIAMLLIYAATRPDTFRVERSIRIQAPPDRIYALIDDMHAFNTWNPYERKDPAIKGRYGNTTRGKGALYAWESEKVGTGQMEIVDSTLVTKVTMKLDFVKPFEAHNLVDFTLQPDGETTLVTWVMSGPSPYFSKVMQVFFSMDKMVGKDFEDGLANLKTIAEKPRSTTQQ